MEEDRGDCPNCGHSKIDSDSCIKCGIVFAKYQRVIPEDTSKIIKESQSKQKGSKMGPLILILIPLLIAAYTVYKYFSPDVNVYVEGSYTQTEAVAYVYADVNVSCLYKFGVKWNSMINYIITVTKRFMMRLKTSSTCRLTSWQLTIHSMRFFSPATISMNATEMPIVLIVSAEKKYFLGK